MMNQEDESPFFILLPELKRDIFARLSFADLGRVALTCRAFAHLVNAPADGLMYAPRGWRRMSFFVRDHLRKNGLDTVGHCRAGRVPGFRELLRLFRERGYFARLGSMCDCLHASAIMDPVQKVIIFDVYFDHDAVVGSASIQVPLKHAGFDIASDPLLDYQKAIAAGAARFVADHEGMLLRLFDTVCHATFVSNHPLVVASAADVSASDARLKGIRDTLSSLHSDLRDAFDNETDISALVEMLRAEHRTARLASNEHLALVARASRVREEAAATYMSPFFVSHAAMNMS